MHEVAFQEERRVVPHGAEIVGEDHVSIGQRALFGGEVESNLKPPLHCVDIVATVQLHP